MEFKEIDLAEELAKETASVEPEITAETIADPFFDPGAPEGGPDPISSSESSTTPDVSAKVTVSFLEGLSLLLLPRFLKNKMITPTQSEIIDKIEVLGGEQLIDDVAVEEQMTALKARDRFREAVRGIPFSEEEKAMLEDPLKRIFEKHSMSVSPEFALIMAVAVIFSGRIAPAFIK